LKTTFLWEVADLFDMDGRGITLADWFGPVAEARREQFLSRRVLRQFRGTAPGQEHVQSARLCERSGEGVLVHHRRDMETSAFFRNSTQLALSPMRKDLQKIPDGSVDVYIGPKAPAGKESNWLYTPEGKNCFPWFSFYGPEKAVLDKSWKMPDIELVKQ
jgi:hypothetical protein